MTVTQKTKQSEAVWVVFADPFIDGKFYGRWCHRDHTAPHGFRVPEGPMKRNPHLFNTPYEAAQEQPDHYWEAMAFWKAQQLGHTSYMRYSVQRVIFQDPWASDREPEMPSFAEETYGETDHVAFFPTLKDVADFLGYLRQANRWFTYSAKHDGWCCPLDRDCETEVYRVMVHDVCPIQDRKRRWSAFSSYVKSEFERIDALRNRPAVGYDENWVDDSDPEGPLA